MDANELTDVFFLDKNKGNNKKNFCRKIIFDKSDMNKLKSYVVEF